MTPKETFEHQGYRHIPGALDAETLSMLQQTCDALLEEPPSADNDRHSINLGAARRFLSKRHEEFPDLTAFLTGETMAAIVREHLDGEGFLFNEQFVVKGAGTGASFAWHQDSAYVGFDHAAYLSVWIALDDATTENGCVYIQPRDLHAQPGIDPHEWDEVGKELNGYTGPEPGIAMEAKAGDVVLFSSLTLHRSGENRTDRPRRAYLAQYSPVPILDPATREPKTYAKPFAA